MELEVRDDPAHRRYVAEVDGREAFVEYRRRNGRIMLTHTEVPEEIEGQGVGSALARVVLDRIRDEGLDLDVRCPFIRAYIRRHPEYEDMVVGGLS